MLNKIRNAKKGFTLVEVIVVLVIIAILAAILIPALIGYIDKANEKKVIAEARSLLIAAQTEVSDRYSSSSPVENGTIDLLDDNTLGDVIFKLAELSKSDIDTASITVLNGKVNGVTYKAKGSSQTAEYDGTSWEIK